MLYQHKSMKSNFYIRKMMIKSFSFLHIIVGVSAVSKDHDHLWIRRMNSTINQQRELQIQLPQCGVPPCWCDMNEGATCPSYPESSIYTSRTDVADFFSSLTLENPNYIELQLCSPSLTNSVNLEGISVDPDILNNENILTRSNSGGSSGTNSKMACHTFTGSTPVCGIKFSHNGGAISPDNYDPDCSSESIADSYKIKTFRNGKALKQQGYFRLHEGSCGVCSTAKDLASYMRNSFPNPNYPTPTIDTMAFLCKMAIASTYPGISSNELVSKVSVCLQHGIPNVVPSADLSETCAYAWAINVFLTGLPEVSGGCNTICSSMLNLIVTNQCLPNNPATPCPYDPVSCDLHKCLVCDDSVSGDAFIELAGMTRRNAGIHTLLPRTCGSLSDISHSCVACKVAM